MHRKLMNVRVRCELSRERATRLEGSFGTQKQHYLLSKNKGMELEDRNIVDFLRDTYRKCRTDDRQSRKQNS